MATPVEPVEGQVVAFRRFAVRGSIFVTVLLLGCAALLSVPAPANDFLQAIQDKERVLSAAPSPRTVLVGGSSTAFGFNSAALAAATGRSVVNMGVHAGLGLDFMLRSVEDSLRAGDLVIVSPEYELFDKSLRNNTVLYQILPYMQSPDTYLHSVAERVEYRLQLRVQRMQRIVAHLMKRMVGRTTAPDMYRRASFSALGDFWLPDSTRSVLDTNRYIGPPKPAEVPDESTVRRLSTFADKASQRGASVVLLYPPLVSPAYARDSANIAGLQQALEKTLRPAVTIAGTPQDFVWPAEYFFDTEYHLNPRGRDRRTSQLIQFLQSQRLANP
ncbi:MAG: hypothetical protein H7Z40_01425 [Phycisphaerae bacterium]|nr:hypothetical protein [Gemmatimonadaceae bacterium]